MSGCTSDSSSLSFSRSGRRGASFVAANAALLLGAALLVRSVEADGGKEGNASLMKELSQRFQILEGRLNAVDKEGIVGSAAELSDFVPRLAELTAESDGSGSDVFERHVARFGELVSELSGLASEGRFVGTAQAFEELRATCVSCHLRFRTDNYERGDYPARNNTLTGVVELRDVNDEAREDRSWVLVFLEEDREAHARVVADRSAKISQSGRRFHPRVLPVLSGTQVEFPNDDTIFHNVFSLSKVAPFDLGVYEPGESTSVRMERTGLVKVYCNIHPEMTASIVVLDNPWFALTDPRGRFVVCGVPDGEYVLRAWNDMGAEVREPISLAGGRVHEERLELRETRRAVSHTNKHGKPYPSKYR